MSKFRNWTIRTKLTVILMATSTVAVFLAGLAGIAFSVYETRLWHEKHLDSIIGIISYNCQAALAFGIPEDAERILSSLDTDESIIMACIFDAKGDLLAVYRQTEYPEKLPPPSLKSPRHEYKKGHLEIYQPIYLEGEEIGSIYVLDNRLDEKMKINRDITVLVLVMFLALLVAYIMSWQLQRLISGPILSLAQTAANIADKKDYSIRAVKQSHDEVGTLIDSFNDMLTQIQKAEEILSQSEERYRTLVENIGLGITLIDKEHNILMANAAIDKMFNVAPASFIGKKCYHGFEKKSYICTHCPGAKAFRTHMPEEADTEGVRDDGSKFPVRVRAFPMFDNEDNPTGFIEVVEDITERKKTEKLLQETESRFTDFFQNAPIGFHIFGPNQMIIDINNAELEMIGYSREEVINRKTWTDLIIPQQKAILEQHWKDITSSGSVKNIEYTLIHKDGHHVDVIINASARFDDRGNLINTRGSVIDISERKRMTEQLTQSRQMLKTVLDTINVRVFWKDRNSNYLGCNRLFALDAGLEDPNEIIGKNDYELAWKEQADSYSADDKKVIKSGQSKLKYEEPQTTPEGKSVWLSTSKIPLRDNDNNIIGVLGTYEDITERKVTEQERERLMWILEAKNRELESIVYTSSHDLRSTIVNVQGFSSELSMTCDQLLTVLNTIPIPQDTKDTLLKIVQDDIPTEIKYITASASKMDMLINGLLKLSRLGRVVTRPENIDMNSQMSTIIDSMKFQIRESATKVSVENLPPCKADVSQITQIFWNLIDNAIKYLDPQRQGIIEISGSVKDKMSVYCVSDNGKGISPRHQKNIFEVFHRLEPEGNVSGEGLGLSIIKRIVDRHGGDVHVESTPGKGSKFFIEMPSID